MEEKKKLTIIKSEGKKGNFKVKLKKKKIKWR